MNQKKTKHGLSFLRIMPALICCTLAVLFLIYGRDLSLGDILSYTPEDPLRAACMLILLYALKSLSIVFPVIVLQAAAGVLFPPIAALAVNTVGMAVCLSLPYWVGRFSGADAIGHLIEKYPKVSAVVQRQQQHSFFLCFFTRIISCLPGDVVSLYLGSLRIPFGVYLPAALLGVLPGMAAATGMGTSISDPTSPVFILSALATVLLAACSLLLYRRYRGREPRKDEIA